MLGAMFKVTVEIVATLVNVVFSCIAIVIDSLADTDLESSGSEPETNGFNVLSGKYEPGGIYLDKEGT